MALQIHQHLVQSIKPHLAPDPIHFDVHLEFKDVALAAVLDYIDDAGGSNSGPDIWRRRERRPLSQWAKSQRHV